jgi:branched-chain amino acid transport system permease protein
VVSGAAGFYLLVLVLCVGGALLFRRALYAPFGFALRATRDSPLRAAAIGLDADRLRLAAFAIAGAGAGLSGGLFAYAKRSVFPTYVSVSHSMDALVMVLLGGVQSRAGPIVGGAVYTLLYDLLLSTAFWRIKLGALIVALVLFFPDGIAGTAFRIWQKRRAA